MTHPAIALYATTGDLHTSAATHGLTPDELRALINSTPILSKPFPSPFISAPPVTSAPISAGFAPNSPCSPRIIDLNPTTPDPALPWFWTGPVQINPDISLILRLQADPNRSYVASPRTVVREDLLGTRVTSVSARTAVFMHFRPNDPIPRRLHCPTCPPFVANHWHAPFTCTLTCINPFHVPDQPPSRALTTPRVTTYPRARRL